MRRVPHTALARRPHHCYLTPRVFSVLAAAALLATVLPGAASASAVPSYVALGDSYTSGPLIPDQTGNPAGCLRSTHDYPALVAAAPGAASFSNVSCAGAFGSSCKNHYTAGGTGQLALAISQTAPKVAAVLAAIHQKAPSARVLVVGYPVVLPGTGHGRRARAVTPAAARCLAASRCRSARASHQSWPACP